MTVTAGRGSLRSIRFGTPTNASIDAGGLTGQTTGFAVTLPVFAKAAPVLFTAAFTGLEFLVAFLQAFIFTVLTCIYLNDAVNMHH